MSNSFTRGMARATELTRSGKLDEATALIQSLLLAPDGTAKPYTDVGPTDPALPRYGTAGPAPTVGPAATRSRKTRKALGETLRAIAAGGMPQHGVLVTPLPVDLPHGARFLALAHSGAQGSRNYRLYVPATQPSGPMPLIVMLHGCTQSPEDFAIGTGMNGLAEQFGCLVAWPAQPQGANAQKCWNWFRPEDQAKGRGEPAVIAGIVRDILRDHPADPARIYVAGLSAGGAAAAIMGATYPELVAAVGVHSGLPVGGAQDIPSAFAAMRSGATGSQQCAAAPTIVFHGLADTTVNPRNGAAVIAQALRSWPGLAPVHVCGVSDGARTYRQTRYNDASGRSIAEHWEIDGAGHAWAGGHDGGSHTDPTGPDASREIMRFFLQHQQT